MDLSQIEREDIEVTDNSIRIVLPPPVLLSRSIDVERSSVYDYDRGLLNLGPDAPELQSLAEQQGLRALIVSACEFGLLERANREAQLAVTELMSSAGYQQVIVETQEPAPDACPTTLE